MDKNIFNEAVLTSGQKARLKERIFETDIKIEDNKVKKVFPFKAIGLIAAAFALVLGVTALIGVLSDSFMVTSPPMYSSGSDNHIASNGGVDDPDKITIEMTKLKAKYPQYFNLDTTKGLEVYVWYISQNEELCAILPTKDGGYKEEELATLEGLTLPQMKEVLKSYTIDFEKIGIYFFNHPLCSFKVDLDYDVFRERIRRELGLDDEETADLRTKYPQYFNLDTTKGLVIYTWFTLQTDDEDVCVLVPGKNIGYTDDEILSMPTVTVSQMKEILRSYNLSSDKISVAFFEPPYLATAEYDPGAFVKRVRKELGLEENGTYLHTKYPQYFNLDTGKGLEVYVWQPAPDSYSCVLAEGSNRAYTDDEILALPEATLADMKEILSSYDASPEMIVVSIFRHPYSSFLADINQSFIPMLRERLGITLESYDEWGINMSVAFKNDTEFVLSIGQTLPEGVHMDGQLTTSPEYELYVDYEGERIAYSEYAQLMGLQYNGPFAWNTVLYMIEENGWLMLNEDISLTYGKLPGGKYYIKKNVVYYSANGECEEKNYFAAFEIE